jgi:hypothetical protein
MANRKLRTVFLATALATLAGCEMPQETTVRDPERAILFVHVMAADLAILAESTAGQGEDTKDMQALVADMKDALATLPDAKPARELRDLVRQAEADVALIGKRMEAVREARDAASAASIRIPQVTAQWSEVIRGMSDFNAPLSQVLVANRQVVLADRMPRRIDEILQGGHVAVTAGDALQRDIVVYDQVTRGFVEGDPQSGLARVESPAARAALEKIIELNTQQVADTEALLRNAQALAEVRQAVDHLHALRTQMLGAAPPSY